MVLNHCSVLSLSACESVFVRAGSWSCVSACRLSVLCVREDKWEWELLHLHVYVPCCCPPPQSFLPFSKHGTTPPAAWPWGLISPQICDTHHHHHLPVLVSSHFTPSSCFLSNHDGVCVCRGGGDSGNYCMCLFCGVLLCHSPLMICHNFQTLCFKVTFICFAIFDLLLFC